MPIPRWLGHVGLWLWVATRCIPAWAGTVEIIIPPVSSPAVSTSVSSAMTAASTTSAADVLSTPTSFYAFQRYPGKLWYYLTPWNGQEIRGVAIVDDYGITVWWIVYGIWNENGIEDWETRLTKPDGTFEGLHWHTEMRTVNGVYEKCFVASDPVTHQERGQFCKDDPTYGLQTGINTIIFGYTHTFWSDNAIEIRSANLTHNGTEIWATPWLLSDVALVNPNPRLGYKKLIEFSGALSSNLNDIVNAYSPSPAYVVADGVTPLFLFAGSTAAVPVSLKITSGSTEDGTLSDFYGGLSESVSISPVMQRASNNNDYGVGLYRAPPEFARVNSSAFNRPVTLEADFEVPWQSEPAVVQLPFQLIRTPLVLIHGMWSNPNSTWAPILSNIDVCGNRICQTVDWHPADSPLPGNITYVWNKVHNLLDGLRAANVAVSKLDVLAHSAGGPLFRLYTQTPYYWRQDNFVRGDVRKFLTVGSPHRGTPIADFVQQLLASADPIVVKAARKVFVMIGRSTTNGIITDLSTSSNTMRSIQPTASQAHAWIGSLPSLSTSSSEQLLWGLLAGVCLTPGANNYTQCQGIAFNGPETLRSYVFSGQANDGLVPRNMQAGGIAGTAQTTLYFTSHTQEVGELNSVEVAGVLDGTGGLVDTGGFR